MSTYEPIDCGDYDYLEIVCMDKCLIEVATARGLLAGTAKTLVTEPTGEYLCLQGSNGDTEQVRVDRILKIRVLSQPRRFDEHEFSQAP